MKRRLHLAAAIVVGLAITCVGGHLAGLCITDDALAFGIGLLVGVVVGVCELAYWDAVIDRHPRTNQPNRRSE